MKATFKILRNYYRNWSCAHWYRNILIIHLNSTAVPNLDLFSTFTQLHLHICIVTDMDLIREKQYGITLCSGSLQKS